MNPVKVDKRIRIIWVDWFDDLSMLCYECNLNMEKYNQETIKEYFAEGLTVQQAYKQLLSEIEIGDDNEQ